MNDAKLYSKSNVLQKNTTIDCLNEFAKNIKWINHANIIDVGCGDGSTTANILPQYLPEDFKSLVGGDVSENMVQFAAKNFRGERTSFMRIDIVDTLPQELVGYFDHAFSFYAFHWIKKQKEAFTNIYNLLSEGGSCLLLFVGYTPVYEAFRKIACGAKWKAYCEDVERFISPYQDSQEPEKELQVILKEIGFRNIDVRDLKTSYTFTDRDDAINLVKSINTCDIPLDMWEDFFSDYLNVLSGLNTVELSNDGAFSLTYKYTLFVVMASK